MLKKNYLNIIYVLVVLLVVLLFIRIKKEDGYKEKLPYLVEGERIEYFELIGLNNELINSDFLKKSEISLIFIFKEPCGVCNGNLIYWNRIARILKDKDVNIYGVVLGGKEKSDKLNKEAVLNFDVYFTKDRDKFKKYFRLKHNFAQTLVCIKNKVFMNIFGKLEGELYTECLKTIKILIKKNKIK